MRIRSVDAPSHREAGHVLSTRRGLCPGFGSQQSYIWGPCVFASLPYARRCIKRGVLVESRGMPSLYSGLTRRGGRDDLLRGGAHNTLIDGGKRGLCHSMGSMWHALDGPVPRGCDSGHRPTDGATELDVPRGVAPRPDRAGGAHGPRLSGAVQPGSPRATHKPPLRPGSTLLKLKSIRFNWKVAVSHNNRCGKRGLVVLSTQCCESSSKCHSTTL